MRSIEEYRQLRAYVEREVKATGHHGDRSPILYYGALVALRAMNSKDSDPIDAFERLKNELHKLIEYDGR